MVGKKAHTKRERVRSPFCEPTFWSKPCFSLRRARRHQCEGQQATQTGENALDEKKIPPSCNVMSAQLEDARSQEGTDNLGHVI